MGKKSFHLYIFFNLIKRSGMKIFIYKKYIYKIGNVVYIYRYSEWESYHLCSPWVSVTICLPNLSSTSLVHLIDYMANITKRQLSGAIHRGGRREAKATSRTPLNVKSEEINYLWCLKVGVISISELPLISLCSNLLDSCMVIGNTLRCDAGWLAVSLSIASNITKHTLSCSL